MPRFALPNSPQGLPEATSRLTPLSYRLPLLPPSAVDMGEMILRESVKEFIQTPELETWEDKESVIQRAVLATPEECLLCYYALSAIRQVSVEKGVRIRDLAENQSRVKSRDYWGNERATQEAAALSKRGDKQFVSRDRIWHPRRSQLVVAPRFMQIEACFHALDGIVAVPPDHDRLLEFDEAGHITRDVPGAMTQIPFLIVPFPDPVTLPDLCREIRMQLARKRANLREVPVHGARWGARSQLVRDEIHDCNVASLVITGLARRHVACGHSRAATDIWTFLLMLVEEGIHVTICGMPSVINMLSNDDFRVLFPKAAYEVDTLRPEDAGKYMSYFWNVIGIDEEMPERFVHLAAEGLYQRALITPLLVDFNRRVNRNNEDWRVALEKARGALTGDMGRLQGVYRKAIETRKIAPPEENKYLDELPRGLLKKLAKG